MQAKKFVEELSGIGIDTFVGVPDSLMSSLSKHLELSKNSNTSHKILHNEGGAVGYAIGKFIANKKISAVYLQNSGLGNIINPITSLTNDDVFSIPILYIIGWRGEPGVKDEPQHTFQGKITLDLLNLLDIQYSILNSEEDLNLKEVQNSLSSNRSYALIIKKDFFDKDTRTFEQNENELTRFDVLKKLYESYNENTLFVSTTGKTSRELYEITKEYEFSRTFFSVGGMGHTSSISLGLVENSKENQVVCFDGDGSFLMHMGAIALIGASKVKNLHYILLNNYSHESVGGQPTIAKDINFKKVSEAYNFDKYILISNREEMKFFAENLEDTKNKKTFVEIKIDTFSDSNLPRPNLSPKEYLQKFKD